MYIELPFDLLPQAAIEWAETQDLPDDVNVEFLWDVHTIEFERDRPPWEPPGSRTLYEAWCMRVAYECVGEDFRVTDYLDEKYGRG